MPAAAVLTAARMRSAIPRLRKRIAELEQLDVESLDERDGPITLSSLRKKIVSTYGDIYGHASVEFQQVRNLRISPRYLGIGGQDVSIGANREEVKTNVRSAIASLKTSIEMLDEKLAESDDDSASRVMQAYEGLKLHPEIARASTKLYQDGHYSTAVEKAVVALNDFVRLRSSSTLDGVGLMQKVFSPKDPILKFNDLTDRSDLDEQMGFMNLFCGAVSGLRNPRAHSFIHDEPERALEFIAFVSLLAKLLDEADR